MRPSQKWLQGYRHNQFLSISWKGIHPSRKSSQDRALTPNWEKKTTAIEETNDLSTMSLKNLISNLMAYEVQLEDRKKDEQ